MELVRQWLSGVTCAALIAALADGLMPKGPVKQMGKLVCALVLLCTVLGPVLTLSIPEPVDTMWELKGEREDLCVQLERHSGVMLKTLIERQSGAYIVDKATQLGLVCRAEVACEPGEGGTWLPYGARVTGQLDAEQVEALTAVIQNELGIPPERQVYAGGE